MKSALSIALIVCLAGSTLPAAALEPGAADLIARSMTREATRFAAAPQHQSADAEWSRVRNLAPGTEVVLTVKGSQPDRQYFVQADESDLTVRKAAGLGSHVEKIARTDVVEIRTIRTRGSVPRAALWATGGYFVGGFAGGMAGGIIGGAVGCAIGQCRAGKPNIPAGVGVGFLSGIVVGASVGVIKGGVHGYRSHTTVVEEAIYRAP
jgi:hypothetical protein